ncbi:hypothetical protein PR048_027632 [Dryococelus australis]|uniref:Uncharacterized protein n=1 Tax=Dryococelus australis TaxID=614101 RepID=A0ABQ9GH25_9NEOP|nr:hypothetical protein PR048_027632 [Dryococelus australis]
MERRRHAIPGETRVISSEPNGKSATFPTCELPGLTPPGIEPRLPLCEASGPARRKQTIPDTLNKFLQRKVLRPKFPPLNMSKFWFRLVALLAECEGSTAIMTRGSERTVVALSSPTTPDPSLTFRGQIKAIPTGGVRGKKKCRESCRIRCNRKKYRFHLSELSKISAHTHTLHVPLPTTEEAAVAERLARLPPSKAKPGSISGRVAGFSQVGIVPDDAVDRRVFPGISRSPPPHPFIPATLRIHFNRPHRLSRPRSLPEISLTPEVSQHMEDAAKPLTLPRADWRKFFQHVTVASWRARCKRLFHIAALRADEDEAKRSTEQRRNCKGGGRLENPDKTLRAAASSGQDSCVRKSGSDPAGNRTRFASVGCEYSIHYTTVTPTSVGYLNTLRFLREMWMETVDPQEATWLPTRLQINHHLWKQTLVKTVEPSLHKGIQCYRLLTKKSCRKADVRIHYFRKFAVDNKCAVRDVSAVEDLPRMETAKVQRLSSERPLWAHVWSNKNSEKQGHPRPSRDHTGIRSGTCVHWQRKIMRIRDVLFTCFLSYNSAKANRVRFPPRSTGISHVRNMAYVVVGRVDFSRGTPVSPALAFHRCSVLISFRPYRRSCLRCIAPTKASQILYELLPH